MLNPRELDEMIDWKVRSEATVFAHLGVRMNLNFSLVALWRGWVTQSLANNPFR